MRVCYGLPAMQHIWPECMRADLELAEDAQRHESEEAEVGRHGDAGIAAACLLHRRACSTVQRHQDRWRWQQRRATLPLPDRELCLKQLMCTSGEISQGLNSNSHIRQESGDITWSTASDRLEQVGSTPWLVQQVGVIVAVGPLGLTCSYMPRVTLSTGMADAQDGEAGRTLHRLKHHQKCSRNTGTGTSCLRTPKQDAQTAQIRGPHTAFPTLQHQRATVCVRNSHAWHPCSKVSAIWGPQPAAATPPRATMRGRLHTWVPAGLVWLAARGLMGPLTAEGASTPDCSPLTRKRLCARPQDGANVKSPCGVPGCPQNALGKCTRGALRRARAPTADMGVTTRIPNASPAHPSSRQHQLHVPVPQGIWRLRAHPDTSPPTFQRLPILAQCCRPSARAANGMYTPLRPESPVEEWHGPSQVVLPLGACHVDEC